MIEPIWRKKSAMSAKGVGQMPTSRPKIGLSALHRKRTSSAEPAMSVSC